MGEVCQRCGFPLPDESPCANCWDGTASADLVRELVAASERAAERVSSPRDPRPPLGTPVLSKIDAPEAAPALRDALRHQLATVRGAAARSLGFSGDARDAGALISLLSDEHPEVRSRARGALAELGGQTVADALFDSIPGLDIDERSEVQAALAWLGDSRDLETTRHAAHAWLAERQLPKRRLAHHGWGAVYAVLCLGDHRDAEKLVETLLARGRSAKPREHGRGMPPDLYNAQSVSYRFNRMLKERGFSDLAERCEQSLRELVVRSLGTGPRPVPVPVDVEPVGGRSIPRLAMSALSESPVSPDGRPAKFGGQPDWLQAPAWPLSPSDHPMIFLGQLPLLGHDNRLAYIFFSNEVDETWEPLSVGNAVVVQPGDGAAHVPTAPLEVGPQLFEIVHDPHRYQQVGKMRPYERYISLEPGADPLEWKWPELAPNTYPANGHGDWNKIGGTPAYLQGHDVPPGPGWKFAFQFTAGWAGHEFADGAECYGFVNEDGRGAFLWQCH